MTIPFRRMHPRRRHAHAGADSPSQAGTLINLGLVLIEVPDPDAAETALTESLRIWEKKYGREFAVPRPPSAVWVMCICSKVNSLARKRN